MGFVILGLRQSFYAGYNTRQGLALLRRLLPLRGSPDGTTTAQQPRLLTIKFGANDAADAALVPKQHVPLTEYEANLTAMVAYAREVCPAVTVVLITPPTVNEAEYAAENLRLGRRKEGEPLNRTVAGVQPYAEAVRRVGVALSAPVVDLWAAPDPIGADGADFVDGLHLDVGGNKKLFERLQATIRELCAADRCGAEQSVAPRDLLLPDDGPGGSPYMPMQFPYWAAAEVPDIKSWNWLKK